MGAKTEDGNSRLRWRGVVGAVQCRAWVWRYRVDNRSHNHLGFNLWVEGEVESTARKFVVAVSDRQREKHQFGVGDVVSGTGWPCKSAKREVADLYRAGGLKVIARGNVVSVAVPPFVNVPPPLEVFKARGARMLDSKLWRTRCMSCMWANKSAVEIEYRWERVKRYRSETFCYGPLSCSLYERGAPRPVPCYGQGVAPLDDGALDSCLTGHRSADE